ncbi:MAG TPA: Dyp-type peroxidase [Solirubrobacterales bacterium]|jgi:hypothetical protein|nr:Dyp-type peroxidase [Solirubrobacterales bacterium]
MAELTRRRLLASAGAGAAGLGLGGASGFLIGRESAEASADGSGSVPFYGEHQAGIDTAAQDRLHFAAFDLVTERRSELRELLREWSRAAAEMTAGQTVGAVNGLQPAPPDDTGETVGLLPSRLTVTFGLGPSLFERRSLGLRNKRPGALREIPPLPADELNAAESGGDVCVQACSDDPQVAFHAIRNLARIGRGTVVMRWSQLGFGRTSSTSRSQDTPRNLMGFKDGTANIRAEDVKAMRRHVWIGELEAGLFFILLPAQPATPVRRDPAAARLERRAERVHQARRQRRLRRAAGRQPRWLRRRNAARLTYSDSICRFLLGCPNFRHVQPKESFPDEPNSRPRPVDSCLLRPGRRRARRLWLERRRARGGENPLL